MHAKKPKDAMPFKEFGLQMGTRWGYLATLNNGERHRKSQYPPEAIGFVSKKMG